jgi:rod shape-determining protein MreC
MKKILTKRGITIGVAAALIAIATLISIKVTSGNSGFLSSAYEALMKPVKSVMSSIAGELEHIYGYMYEYDKIVAENEELKAEIADLQQEYREYTEISEENERLRELLNLSQRHSDFALDTATIISWSASNWSSSFTLSKGSSNSEVAVGDCIVTERGVLVGQVTEVGVATSTAVTIIDTTFSAGALIESSGGAAIVMVTLHS